MAWVTRILMHAAVAALVLGWADGVRTIQASAAPYIYVSKQSPQHLYLIDEGTIIFESPANTGIRAAPTPDGVFRVFASYPRKTMKGIDPVTLRPYNDRNVPYVMYFDGGRAIHGFYRRGYGYPQSLGCVELPVSKARELFGLLEGGLATEVVVAQRRPVFERSRIASGRGWVRPAGLGSERQDAAYRGDAELAAEAPPP